MSSFVKTRRDFLRNLGLGTAVAIPGFVNATKSSAAVSQTGRDVSANSGAKQLFETDVLVVGGGPAGIGAALAAAKKGPKTLLVENHAFFGGIASFCIGMNINHMRAGDKPRSDIHELLIKKLLAYGPLAGEMKGHSLRCNVEYLKVAVLDVLDEVGCKYLVHTRAVDVVMEDNRVVGVVVATKKGLATVNAKVTVDCTGDADVAHFAGAETLYDKDNSPMTLALNVTNFDMNNANESDFKSALRQARKTKTYPRVPRSCLFQRFPSSNTVMINHTGTREYGPIDATDPEQLTAAECFSRRQALQMLDSFHRFGGEALKDAELIATGPQVGVRESRRIKGLYVLTEEDGVAGKKFDDIVAWRAGKIDVGGGVYDADMKVLNVPYRSILPEKVDGLLAAGRCISTTHIAHSAGKSMGNCMATGHAAGLAAALAARKQSLPRDLNVAELQDALRADGVDLNYSGPPGQ
ncbi:MAG: FAD-dependent oxidoreductase [Planctomycetota bacterium]|jgi:ribulose 1,5-bisphosphate synthetase/thiazole synthase